MLFHKLLMSCLAEQRRPTEEEVDSLASKIWRESLGLGSGHVWLDVTRGSDVHSHMTNAALMALGFHPRQKSA